MPRTVSTTKAESRCANNSTRLWEIDPGTSGYRRIDPGTSGYRRVDPGSSGLLVIEFPLALPS